MKWKDSTGRRGQEKEVSNKQKELNSVLCVDIEGWDWGVREAQEEGSICIHKADPHCCTAENKTTL